MCPFDIEENKYNVRRLFHFFDINFKNFYFFKKIEEFLQIVFADLDKLNLVMLVRFQAIKMTISSKVVKSDSKIIICKSKSVTHSVSAIIISF